MKQRSYAIDPVKLAEMLGISDSKRDVLLEASEHPYDCRCSTCADWWKSMGPDSDTGTCGPFTLEEIGLNPEDYKEVSDGTI